MSPVLVVRDARERMLALQSTEPPLIEWTNAAACYHRLDELDAALAPDAPEKDKPAFHLPHIPAPEVRIDDPEFAADLFFLGYWFVSERARNALRLADSDAVFREARVVGANGPARLGYAAMAPVHHLDGIDRDGSDVEWFGEVGAPTSYWELASGGDAPPRVTLRPDLSAPAPVFYMSRTDWLMITQEAADRMRAAEVRGVFFDNPVPAYGSWMDRSSRDTATPR